jgi:hypothetical protein
MPKVNLYAIHDAKAKAYLAPWAMQTDGLAQRSFIQACTNPESTFSQHPLDYSLFRIGVYDDETSLIKSEAPPEHLITAMQATRIAQEEQQKLTAMFKEQKK